jgi:peptide/nickel transport system substrate-binding protein
MRSVMVALALGLLASQAGAKDGVTIGLGVEPPGLDPTTGAAAAISEITWLNIYEGLTRIDEAGTVLPNLAESWSAEDARVYTFKLRRGVRFHNGTALTASQVKFSFERNAAETSTNKRKRVFANMAAIETPDPDTVRITLKQPSSLLPFFLAEATAAIVSPDTAETDATNPIGTGPFRFAAWTRGDSVSLEKFPRYRDAGTVSLERARFRFISDASAQVAALLAGDLDYVPFMGGLDAVERFKTDPRFQILVGATEGETFVGINNRRPPLTDVRVRRAINLALDRQAIIDGVNGGYGQPIASHATRSNPYFLDLMARFPHDPARAKQLLAEAGFANGFETAFKLPPQAYARRGGEIVAAMLAEVGIRARIEPIEWAQWLDVVFKQKNYGLTVIMQPEPWDIFNYTDPNYFYQYDSAEFRDLMRQAEASTTPEAAKANFQAAQRKLADDAVNAWLFEFPKVSVARTGLRGLWRNAPMAVYELAAMRWD